MSALGVSLNVPESVFRPNGEFVLESGARIPGVDVAYRTWGRLAPGGHNAVLVCHALTGSADVDLWWPDLSGTGRTLDPARDFVVASNVLGGCSGTTGPASPGPDGRAWGPDFPAVTIRDQVRLQADLLRSLGVRQLQLVIGGSMGGLQALEWAVSESLPVDSAVVIAASARHSAWCIAWSEAQRQALFADPAWKGGRYETSAPPAAGLAAARAIAMCTYRSRESFDTRFGRQQSAGGGFEVATWLRGHGRKLVDRFDANSWLLLTRAMDGHDVARGRGELDDVLGNVRPPVLVVGIDTDVLYPPAEQIQLARQLRHGEFARLASAHGHDGFLVDAADLDPIVADFRRRIETPAHHPASGFASARGWARLEGGIT